VFLNTVYLRKNNYNDYIEESTQTPLCLRKVFMKYVWGLDLSLSNSGISVFTIDGQFVYVTSIDTSKIKKNHAGKLSKIGEEILILKEKYYPEITIYERGFSRFNNSTQAVFKVFGVVQYLLSDTEQIEYPSTIIKKTVGGMGNMKKDDLRNVIIKKYGHIGFDNLDQSDSFAIAVCYFMKMGVL
jgi:Holliday junction resolvasome RuvABC endonuclease subunit